MSAICRIVATRNECTDQRGLRLPSGSFPEMWEILSRNECPDQRGLRPIDFLICTHTTIASRNECPDQRGLRLLQVQGTGQAKDDPERMPRSEGIETCRFVFFICNSTTRNECPDQRGLRQNSSLVMPALFKSPGTNAPIRGD